MHEREAQAQALWESFQDLLAGWDDLLANAVAWYEACTSSVTASHIEDLVYQRTYPKCSRSHCCYAELVVSMEMFLG